MKSRLLLFLLLVTGYLYAQEPYRQLMITEISTANPSRNYVEITNVGDKTINLGEFRFGNLGLYHAPILDVNLDPWVPQSPYGTYSWMLPSVDLAPGKSYVITGAYDFGPRLFKKNPFALGASERPKKTDFYKVANLLLHYPETNGDETDSITLAPYTYDAINTWDGRNTYYLEHVFAEGDSAVIDQFGGVFDDVGVNASQAYDVAGVVTATAYCAFARKYKYNTGNLDFANARGLGDDDSEWIVLPNSGDTWRDTWWITGNHGNYVLDANTLESDVIGVDFAGKKLTVPWGIRRLDDIMRHMKKKPGIAWYYRLNGNSQDSVYTSAKTGDRLVILVCGNDLMKDTFDIVVSPPTASANMVVPIRHNGTGGTQDGILDWPRVTTYANGVDTISGGFNGIPYDLRTDSLLRYLEKPANATWEFVWVDGVKRIDLKQGDKLKVTSQNGSVKEYFIQMRIYRANSNPLLASITWPDIPAFYRGIFGWKGDTIPGFSMSVTNYKVEVPLDVEGIPALVAKPYVLNSKIVVKRAKSLAGSLQDRTLSFVVTAEDDSTVTTYNIEFVKEVDPVKVQPFIGDPFLSEFVKNDIWFNNYAEVFNPSNQPIDLSNYMFVMEWGNNPAQFIQGASTLADSLIRYKKYVPGKKWASKKEWASKIGLLEPDFNIDPILPAGGTFVMSYISQSPHRRFGYISSYPQWTHGGYSAKINFGYYPNDVGLNLYNLQNPWGENPSRDNGTVVANPSSRNFMIFKITNDSVKNGLKPATDPNDFELVDNTGNTTGTGSWKIETKTLGDRMSWRRKPEVYKGNTVSGASFGTTWADSEWLWWDVAYWSKIGHPIGISWFHAELAVAEDLGRHTMIAPTHYKSTVASLVYKVSPGYLMDETIDGLTTGTTVTTFFENLIKANDLQTLKVKSNGVDLLESAAISDGDILTVLSADSVNTSAYKLGVTVQGLSANATLTSVPYTINVTGSTGTISGFSMGTQLKTILEGVTVPAGALLTITDENDAYMSLIKLNFDTAYVNATATDAVYFEVLAENGINKILYQLKPTSSPSDAYVTSDVFSVDQFASVIQHIPWNSTVFNIVNNVTPAPGATVKIYDRIGLERPVGGIYQDDKLVAISEDGLTTKAYYLVWLSDSAVTYLAFVISDDYQIDQVGYKIKGPVLGWTSVSDFYSKLYSSFGATMQVLDKDGNVSTAANLAVGDQLLVTAADGKTKATYQIEVATRVMEPVAQLIKMYPNPTYDGRVVVQGLTKGNRVRVFNAAGITLRDVIAENSTDYVSLASQPAGIYVFVISSGEKNINIQKIIKK